MADIRQKETLVYYVNAKGEIMMAPDSRISPKTLNLQGWRQFEAVTAKEKETIAGRLAEQIWKQKKAMKIEQRMREQEQRNVIRANCKIRIAQGFSPADIELNKAILIRMDQHDERFFKELAQEFDPTTRTSALECELKDAVVGMAAHPIGKRVGIHA